MTMRSWIRKLFTRPVTRADSQGAAPGPPGPWRRWRTARCPSTFTVAQHARRRQRRHACAGRSRQANCERRGRHDRLRQRPCSARRRRSP